VPTASLSLREEWADLTDAELDTVLARYTETELEALIRSWQYWGRPDQLEPEGDWRWWMLLTGRGYGKTRTGSEWTADRCEAFARIDAEHLIGLMNSTNDDVRSIQLHGESGLGSVAKRRGHVLDHTGSALHGRYGVPTERGMHWSRIEVHTGVLPDKSRGRNFHTVWADELAAWRHKVDNLGGTAFSNAVFSLRGSARGLQPRGIVTTTPKPITIIRELVKGEHGRTHITTGSLLDNAANLPPSFVHAVYSKYSGTRLGAQEIEGLLLDSVEGALWTPDLIDQWRVKRLADVPELSTTIVALDPSGSEGGDECGIIVVGLARQRDAAGRPHLYVLDDASVQNRPAVWAPHVLDLVDKWDANCVVAETNFGGKLVVDTLTLRRPGLRVEEVRASKGKRVRAEPVSTIYETGQVHHVGYLSVLEEQMATWTPLEPTSPDRMDALVWGATWLIPDLSRPPSSFAKSWADRRAVA
jgi:phage terminase large subunit-like protein